MVRILGEHEHLRHDGLKGWCEACPEEKRHEALERVVREDGYATAVRRLNLLATYSKRDNPHLHRTALEDEAWLHRRHEREEHKR